MITVDLSLHGLAHGNFFNFLIIAIAIIVCFKLKLIDVLNAAKENVVDVLHQSDNRKKESEDLLVAVKDEVKNLPQELAKIDVEAKNTVDAYKKSVDIELEQITQRLEDNADKVIDNELRMITSALQKELAFSSLEVAHKKTLDSLLCDSTLHRKFINEAIEKIEGIEIK